MDGNRWSLKWPLLYQVDFCCKLGRFAKMEGVWSTCYCNNLFLWRIYLWTVERSQLFTWDTSRGRCLYWDVDVFILLASFETLSFSCYPNDSDSSGAYVTSISGRVTQILMLWICTPRETKNIVSIDVANRNLGSRFAYL